MVKIVIMMSYMCKNMKRNIFKLISISDERTSTAFEVTAIDDEQRITAAALRRDFESI